MRCVYVIFYKTGEIYAGKISRADKLGNIYFGSSGIAKTCKLKVAHIKMWNIPKDMSKKEYNRTEQRLICYIAERYGLDNKVKYRSKEEWWNRFSHNGRCINCHCYDSLPILDMLKFSIDAKCIKAYGVPFNQVTEEMRKEHKRAYLKKYNIEHKEELKRKRFEYNQKEEVKQYKIDYMREYNRKISEDKKKKKAMLEKDPKYIESRKILLELRLKKRKDGIIRRGEMAFNAFGAKTYVSVDGKDNKISIKEVKQGYLDHKPKNPNLLKYYKDA